MVFCDNNPSLRRSDLNLAARPRVSVRAKISALGTWTPPRLLTNADLEKMVATTDEWITSRVGIRERHIVEPGMATSHMAVEAAKLCLAERGVDPAEVEVIIVGTVTPDMLFPATACLVQDRLGATGAWGFDLSAACSGFVYSLQMGCKLVETGAQKKVLVIGSDTMSSIIDYTDRATCVLFGDGAGAVLIEPAAEGEIGMIDFHHEIDGSGACSLYMPGGGSLHPSSHETVEKKMHYVHQDGQAVYKFAVRKMVEATETVMQRNGVTGADLDVFISHQANRRIITSTADRLGLPEEKVIINIDRFGNTTCGTIPLAMETARQEGKLKKGDLVLIASVGAGFTVGAALLRWEC
jgi:3-oxoacyl-[acyl-carrier-protein] synthase III